MSDDLKKFNLNKNIPFAVMAFTINVGLVFLSYRLVIAKSGIEAVGLWSTLFAWTALIRIGDVGMTGAALRFVALCDVDKDASKLKQYIETGLLSNTAMFLLMGTLGYFILSLNLTNIVENQYLREAKIVLPLMMISFVLMNVSGTLLGILQGLHYGYINSQLAVAGNVLQIIVVVALVPYLGLAGLAWAQIIQYSFSILFGWYLVRRKSSIQSIIPIGFSKSVFREMLGFSLKAQIANILNGLFEPMSKLLVGHHGGMATLGVYELAYKTVALSRNVVAAGVLATLPSLTSIIVSDPKKGRALYRKAANQTVLFTALIFTVVVLSSPVVSNVWLGRIEGKYILYVIALSVGFLANMYGAPAYQLGMATGTMKNNIFSAFMSIVILWTMSFVLIHSFLVDGVVFATALALVATGIFIRIQNEKLLTSET